MNAKDHFDKSVLWMRVVISVSDGGTGLQFFDELGIPVVGFKENYKRFKSEGKEHIAAWRDAMAIQFEKMLYNKT